MALYTGLAAAVNIFLQAAIYGNKRRAVYHII